MLERTGDEIMVCGQMFHTGTPVVLWTDPGGYDAYRVERRFGPIEQAGWHAAAAVLRSPNRFGSRASGRPDLLERVRGGGWTLEELQDVVDQFVIHYDACGTSRTCFRVLHDERGLSVHFLLDVDGTIYQTLDLKESAWHATRANARSIGIEIANIGAYPPAEAGVLDRWYAHDGQGVRVTIPGGGDGGVRTPGFVARPARPTPIEGFIQGQRLRQYDLTDEQYAALGRLTAALIQIFPKLQADYPRDAQGRLITHVLDDEQWLRYRGLLGHFHVQANKVDPGPAFDWDRVLNEARAAGAHRRGQSARPR
ncbi:MAG: hypothetical protein Kow0022_10800 [Phycisphaerales bacterium]